MEAAREWVESVQAAASDGPGLAGSATLIASPADPDDDVDPGDDAGSGVRLDFENPTELVRADLQCFGGHTASISVTVFTDGGNSTNGFGETIDCDEQPHELLLDPDSVGGANSVLIEAEADPETYVYVAVIERLTIER